MTTELKLLVGVGDRVETRQGGGPMIMVKGCVCLNPKLFVLVRKQSEHFLDLVITFRYHPIIHNN